MEYYPEAVDYLRSGGLLEYAPAKMSSMVKEMKKNVQIPIIASINCETPRLWPSFASQLQDAGADGLELNIYTLPIDLSSPATYYEESHVRILNEIKKKISIPVSVKLTSQITSLPYLSNKLIQAGCDALVFFNWFMDADINVETLKIKNVKGKGDFNQALKWIALLAGRLDGDIAASGGVKKAEDVAKFLLAGASAVQVCTILYQRGINEISNLRDGFEAWMSKHKYSNIKDFQGELSFKHQELSFKDLGESHAYFRMQYLKTFSDLS